MIKMTIMLVGLGLLLGVGVGQAFAESPEQDSAAMRANDAGLSLEGLRRDMGLVYDLPRISTEAPPQEDDGDKGVLACHFTDGCGYAVNPQVMIDLQYRLTAGDETPYTFANNDMADAFFAPNLLLGVHYNF